MSLELEVLTKGPHTLLELERVYMHQASLPIVIPLDDI